MGVNKKGDTKMKSWKNSKGQNITVAYAGDEVFNVAVDGVAFASGKLDHYKPVAGALGVFANKVVIFSQEVYLWAIDVKKVAPTAQQVEYEKYLKNYAKIEASR